MTSQSPISPLSHLLGTTIIDIEGALVGHVTDFLVDEADGRVTYVQFGFKTGGNIPERRVTVPWSSILAARQSEWQLRVRRSALETLIGTSSI